MSALYNEVASYPAQWLRNLISAGHIADGAVDERSIVELEPADVAGPGQRHFFAGIGAWSHALRLAGWPDERSIWTGSCPCQPFSAAGRGRGVDDERHLWPEWFRLIRECRPGVVVGEQVASPAGLGWLDVVSADLEAAGYAVGAVDICAASVGAPHIRQRLFFVAIADVQPSDVHAAERQQGRGVPDAYRGSAAGCVADLRGARLEVVGEQQARRQRAPAERGCAAGELADLPDEGRPWRRAGSENENDGRDADQPGRCGDASQLGYAGRERSRRDPGVLSRAQEGSESERTPSRRQPDEPVAAGAASWVANADKPDPDDEREPRGIVQLAQDATAGFWRLADWIPCADGRSRPVEPGAFPLAHGVAARVGRLRAYGNAIIAPLAAEFIKAVMAELDERER